MFLRDNRKMETWEKYPCMYEKDVYSVSDTAGSEEKVFLHLL